MSNYEFPLLSPCVGNCCLDESDVCLGCFRSVEAIREWQGVDNTTRQRFLDEAEQRRQAYAARQANWTD